MSDEPKRKGRVCKTVNHRVAVDAHACAAVAAPTAKVCHGYVDDRAKAAKSHDILTVHEVPEPKYAATVRFQVRLKAVCWSLADPELRGWAVSAQVLEGLPCRCASYVGDKTWGPAPKDLPGPPAPGSAPAAAPAPAAPPAATAEPPPTPSSPATGQSPPDDGSDDGPDGDHKDDDKPK